MLQIIYLGGQVGLDYKEKSRGRPWIFQNGQNLHLSLGNVRDCSKDCLVPLIVLTLLYSELSPKSHTSFMTAFPQSSASSHRVLLSSEPPMASMASVLQPTVRGSHSACAIAQAAIVGVCQAAGGFGL